MGAPQFFVEPADLTDAVAVVRGDEARHAVGVLRLRVGSGCWWPTVPWMLSLWAAQPVRELA